MFKFTNNSLIITFESMKKVPFTEVQKAERTNYRSCIHNLLQTRVPDLQFLKFRKKCCWHLVRLQF